MSWQFLLGDERRDVTSLLLGRLAAYFAPLTAPAISSSLEVWGKVVATRLDRSWWEFGKRVKVNTWYRAGDAQQKLYVQMGNWYSLLLAGLDPETMLRPYALLRSWRIFKKTFRVLGLEIVIGLAGAGAVSFFGVLSANADQNTTLKTAVALLGFLGITTASVQARLKTTTQSTLARLRQDLSTDLAAAQITVTPKAPKGIRENHIVQRAIAARQITAPLPA